MVSVLLIDDDPDVRALMAVLLNRLGCQALFAPDGVEGQALALQAQPDLILLDIMMNGQNGYKTCANLRAQGYAGRIMMVSAISWTNTKEVA
jgi:CheY-like chemotaxis protein